MGLVKFLLSQDPDEALFTKLGVNVASKTGLTVNERTAMRLTSVYACIRVLSETLASMPIILYRDRKRGDKSSGKDRAVDHPLYDILHNAPNEEMPAFNFKETLMSHVCSSGNGYAQVIRSRGGTVLSLELLPWTEMDVKRNYETKKIEYWTNDRGKQVKLDPDEVFHIPGLGFDGIKGYSPIRMSMEAVGLGLAAEQFGAEFFGRGSHFSGVITYPGKLQGEKLKDYKENLRETYAGLGKTHQLMTLEDGSTFTPVKIPLQEAQFIEVRKFQIEEIARMYRVPMHLLQNLDRSTNNNIEHQSLEFVMYTMLPWFTRWEQYMNFKLLPKQEREKGYFAEFLINNLLRGDAKSRAYMLHLMRQDGVINADQWRELENMNPQEDGQGKHYLINGNMISVDTAAKQPPRQAQTPKPPEGA